MFSGRVVDAPQDRASSQSWGNSCQVQFHPLRWKSVDDVEVHQVALLVLVEQLRMCLDLFQAW